MEMRTFVIGDIHGGLRAFNQAFEKAPISKGDTIIFLGDYVDGWSESAELIERLIQLKEDYTCIFLRGNHDKWCEDWLLMAQKPLIWTQQGGQATIDSYIRTGYITDQRHKDFFRGLHNYYVDDKNRGFVHGGFTSRKGLGFEPYQSDYYWDRDLWGLAVMLHGREAEANNTPKYIRFRKHEEVFIGHTSTTNWNCKVHYPEYDHPQQPSKNGPIFIPMHRCNVWNMDTGGGWHGKLTIMDVDTKEFWQSDLVHFLYPEEKGR